MSIWDGIDRQEFESTILELDENAPYQKPFAVASGKKSRSDGVSSGKSRKYNLPAGVEKQVCDDIAFLAAWQSSPDCVTAATLQESKGVDGVIINLAANEGITDQVKDALGKVFKLLEACAQRGKCSKGGL